jgi:carotenoid cleavage dioxygenase
VIDPASQEFPRPNETLIGKPYRYAYCLAFPEPARVDFAADSKLYKHDLEAGTREVHDFGHGLVPGEFVFVPKEKAAKEDDGWLMGLVINVDSDTTDLVILDAADFTGKPVARITVPHRIPPGFHGNWVAAL